MLWVRNYDDLLESWQRQPSLSLSCIKKTKQNNNKKFNDFLSQDYKYNNDKKIIVKKWRPIWSNAKCFHYMVHMDQQTCSLLFITENWKFFYHSQKGRCNFPPPEYTWLHVLAAQKVMTIKSLQNIILTLISLSFKWRS